MLMLKEAQDAEISKARYDAERKAQDMLDKRQIDREGITGAIYRYYMQEVESKINTFYMSYNLADEDSLKNARARANESDVAGFKKKVIDENVVEAVASDWAKALGNGAKVKREELLRYEIQLDLYKMIKECEVVMLDGMNDEYTVEIERQAELAGLALEEKRERESRIAELIVAVFYGNTLDEKVWGKGGHYDSLKIEIMRVVNNFIADEVDYAKEIMKLREKFDSGESFTERLLITEIGRMVANGQYDFFEEQEYSHYIMVAERGACIVCAALDQSVIPLKDARAGYNYPLMHPNCRCTAYGVNERGNRFGGMSNIQRHDAEYGSYEDSLRDLADIASGKVDNYLELRNKSVDYLGAGGVGI